VDQVRQSPGVTLIDVLSDASHNRTVVTFIGEPEAAKNAAFKLATKAIELIDMEQQHGAHPRIGAADVLPFVPLCDYTVEECIELARSLAQDISENWVFPSSWQKKPLPAPI